MLFHYGVVLAHLAGRLNAQQIVSGQIYTPGIAIVDAPQPNTHLGGGKSPTLNFKSSELTRTRLSPSGSRCNLGWSDSTSSIPLKSSQRDLQYYNLSFELYDKV